MSKRQWIMVLGVWVIVYQFLGLPSSWIKIIGIITGLVICFVAYRLNPEVSMIDTEDRMPYMEHKNPPQMQDVNRENAITKTNSS
jgi:hypothetical protein